MKILHVTNYFRETHEHVGGAEQAAYRIALLARENGCSISVVTTRPDRSGKSEFEVRSAPIVEDRVPGLLRKYIEAAKWYSLQYDPLAYGAFTKILARERPDVAHFHNCQFLTLSLLSAVRKAGIRSIVSIYDYWLFCPTVMLVGTDQKFCARAHGPWCLECLPASLQLFQRPLLAARRKVIDHYLDMVDGFHVLSEHSRSVLEGYGIPGSKIFTAPLTLPLEYTQTADSTDPVDPDMILFVGWLNERKGVNRLLEAMPRVLAEHPSARLTAVGGRVRFGEEYEKKMDEIIDSGRFRDRVTFTGHLQPGEVKRLIQKAGVVVIPEQYENMSPLLMIESMTMAKPLVISRVGGVPEFIEHEAEGWLADPLDPADFAVNILKVLKDPGNAARVAARGREKILRKCDNAAVWEKCRLMYDAPSEGR